MGISHRPPIGWLPCGRGVFRDCTCDQVCWNRVPTAEVRLVGRLSAKCRMRKHAGRCRHRSTIDAVSNDIVKGPTRSLLSLQQRTRVDGKVGGAAGDRPSRPMSGRSFERSRVTTGCGSATDSWRARDERASLLITTNQVVSQWAPSSATTSSPRRSSIAPSRPHPDNPRRELSPPTKEESWATRAGHTKRWLIS